MPLTLHELFELAEHGHDLIELINGLEHRAEGLLELRKRGEATEAELLFGLSETFLGLRQSMLPHQIAFDLVRQRYALKRVQNASAAKRMRKLRAKGGSIPRPPRIPGASELAREAHYARMIAEAQESEGLVGVEEALFGDESPKSSDEGSTKSSD